MLAQIAQLGELLRVYIAQIGLNPDQVLFGNAMLDYVVAAALFVIFLIVFKLIQFFSLKYLLQIAQKTKTDIDDTIIEIFKSLRPPFYLFLAFFLAIRALTLNELMRNIVDVILIVWIVYQVMVGLQILINHVIEHRLGEGGDATTKSAFRLAGRLAKGALWGLAGILILSNLGVDVSSLLAGVGIGGIAIAFALQNILSDLFSSFAIYFDKPFKVGDFVVVDKHMGTVEKIGIKTTRLRALQGEEIVISNRELTSARVQNFKKMRERRITFSFGVLYETPNEKVKKIPVMVQEIIANIEHARFDRAHFKSFDDSALGFEVVYYVEAPDYTEYMNIQQEINVKLKEAFEEEKIGFAYPTQTVYITRS